MTEVPPSPRRRVAAGLLSGALVVLVACGGGDGGGGGEPPTEPTSSSIEGEVARTNDDAGLAGVQVSLAADDGSTQSTSTAGDGSYAFEGVAPGDYEVSVARVDLPELGSLVTSRDTAVSVEGSDPVSGVDFGFRQAETTVDAAVSEASPAAGDVVRVMVALELNPDVPEPFSSVVGEVSWDPDVADFVAGSQQSADAWDLGVVNTSTAGVLAFSAVSAGGAEPDGEGVVEVLTFDVEVPATGSSDVVPELSELQELDVATGASTPLLADLLVEESPTTLDVQ